MRRVKTRQRLKASKVNAMQEGIEANTPILGSRVTQTNLGTFHEPLQTRVLPQDELRQFEVVRKDSTTVEVHAGIFPVYSQNQRWLVQMGIDGGGTSGDAEDVYTLSGITVTSYIVLEIDSWYLPTTLTVVDPAPTSWPLFDHMEKIVIARVHCSGGTINRIEPYLDDIFYNHYSEIDDLSLGFASVGALSEIGAAQIDNWDIAVSGGVMLASSLVPYQYDPGSGRTLRYADQSDFGDWLIDYYNGIGWPASVLYWTDLQDTVGALGDDGDIVYNHAGTLDFLDPEDLSSSIYHTDLLPGASPTNPAFSAAAYEDNEDHDDRMWPNIAATTLGGTYGTDTKTYYTTGDVRADEFALEDDPAANLWNHSNLLVDVATLVDLNAGAVEISSDATDVQISANTELGLFATGLLDIDAWGDLDADILGDIFFDALGFMQVTTDGVFLNSTTTDVDLDSARDVICDAVRDLLFVVGGDVKINNNVGQTLTYDSDNLFEQGFFVNDGSWTTYTIQVVVPGSGVRQLRVLALDVT